MHLIENVLKSWAKIVLTTLGPTASASATDAATHKKKFGSSTRPSDLAKWKTLIISNEKMNGIVKIVKSLEETGLFIKCVRETI